MSDYDLGKLMKVELRDIWMSESSHFTPWLAREENLLTLGETLGLELELEAQEKKLSAPFAPIFCARILERMRGFSSKTNWNAPITAISDSC
ncbi:hypothetical protein ACFSTD_21695 [Novosphingobium colocasiae]